MAKLFPSVTIAIPAYNEAVNISDFIHSVFSCSHRNFSLHQVIVYSDGSTDQTVSLVSRLLPRYPKLKLISGKIRHGKIYRLNQIFSDCSSPFLIVLDADIKLLSSDFLDQLVSEIISYPAVGLLAAHQIPLCAPGLIAHLLYASYFYWDYLRLSIPHQDHVQNFYGAATIYRRSFYRQLHIPPTIGDERLYIYLMAKRVNGFRYTYQAQIAYWPVSQIRDFLKLSNRAFGKDTPQLNRLFGFQANTACIIPTRYKIIGTLKSFLAHPIYTPLALIVNYTFSLLIRHQAAFKSALWEVTFSSKKAY